MKKLRTIIVAGLLVWIPLGITIFVVKLLIDLLGQSYLLIPAGLWPENLLGFSIPGFGIILAVLILLGTGLIAANYLGKTAEIVLSDQTQSFSKVLLIEYPRKGVYSLCFQTSKEVGEIKGKIGDDVVCVYIPTTPNPTSGYIIMVSIDEVIELEMSVEDALKMIISLGVVVPSIAKEE